MTFLQGLSHLNHVGQQKKKEKKWNAKQTPSELGLLIKNIY